MKSKLFMFILIFTCVNLLDGLCQTILTDADVKTYNFLRSTYIPIANFDGCKLSEVLSWLNEASAEFSEDHFGFRAAFGCEKKLSQTKVGSSLYKDTFRSNTFDTSYGFVDFYTCLVDICFHSNLSWKYREANQIEFIKMKRSLEFNDHNQAPLSTYSSSVGIFPSGSHPDAVWSLRNTRKESLKLFFMQQTSDSLAVDYRLESQDWRRVNTKRRFVLEIPHGESVDFRVEIVSCDIYEGFSKNIYLFFEEYPDPLILTVSGVSKSLVKAFPVSPMEVKIKWGKTEWQDSVKLAPLNSSIVLGVPYVTNAVFVSECFLETNSFPWKLCVVADIPNDYVGSFGGEVVLPFDHPVNYPSQTYLISGTVGAFAAKARNPDAIDVEIFAPIDSMTFSRLERDIFGHLDFSPNYHVVRHNIDVPVEAKLLMKRITELKGKSNEPYCVVFDGVLFEGERAIREKLKPLIQR